MSQTTDKTVAVEILRQLGGRKFVAMTGATQLYAIDNGMSCKIMRSKDGINYIQIVLNVMDTYDVTFYSIRGIDIKEVKSLSGIYCDGLKDAIESTTGLALSIG